MALEPLSRTRSLWPSVPRRGEEEPRELSFCRAAMQRCTSPFRLRLSLQSKRQFPLRHQLRSFSSDAQPTKKQRGLLFLGIETSCDDTAAAIISEHGEIVGEALTKQDDVHAPYKGVVPALAAKSHGANIEGTIRLAIERSQIDPGTLTAVAVTKGPGLALCLSVGIKAAQAFALQHHLPLIPVNHMEGHALIPRMADASLEFPYLALLISGGHTQILVCRGVGDYSMLGETIDDAVGAAIDRTATLLGLDYDGGGGKALERVAREGCVAFQFPVAMRSVKNCDFSFAGLKTSARTAIQALPTISPAEQANVAASFQHAIASQFEDRLARAIQWCRVNVPTVKHLVLSGGVACNGYFRERLAAFAAKHGLELKAPPPRLCTDNGIMIAWAGFENWRLQKNVLTGEAVAHPLRFIPRWPLDESGVDYFPASHRSHSRMEWEERAKSAMTRIDAGTAEVRHFLRAAKNFARLHRYDEAIRVCEDGAARFPGSEYLETRLAKLRESKASYSRRHE